MMGLESIPSRHLTQKATKNQWKDNILHTQHTEENVSVHLESYDRLPMQTGNDLHQVDEKGGQHQKL